jgi:DNA-binding transcriptional LysR family regulator
MDSRQLQHFVAVVDHGGFTAASRAVFVSQPALSLAVKSIEEELGAQLFVRVGRRVRLSAAGEALVGPARQALRDLEIARAAVGEVTGLRKGSLALASLPTLAADPVAGQVGSFRRQYPGVRVDLAAPETTSELFELVATGACELGVTEAFAVPPQLVAHGLGLQAMWFILPPGTPLGDRGTLDLSRLAETPFVAAAPNTSTRRLLDESFAAVGLSPELAVVTAQRDAILPLVMAGAGAALVPRALSEVAGHLGAVVVAPDPPIVRALALVHRSGLLSPAASRFMEDALRTRSRGQ